MKQGCEIDRHALLASAGERGDMRVWLDRVRIDIFLPSIELYASAEQRVRQKPLMERPAWFLSAEDLALFKLLFFRSKDLLDVERFVAFAGRDFDRAYVRTWLVDMMGSDDPRVLAWDRLVALEGGEAP